MKLTDYTGKCNNHEDYVRILKRLENRCQYIEYALVNEADTSLIEQFQKLVISLSLRNKWWGTKTSRKVKIYRIQASKELFQYFKRFQTFCIYESTDNGDIAIETDFGINDIAFFDSKELPLLYTTTHEGYIMIRNDLLI